MLAHVAQRVYYLGGNGNLIAFDYPEAMTGQKPSVGGLLREWR